MKLAFLSPLLLLGACATGPDRVTVLNSLVGQPEAQVVRTLGVPTRSYETGGHTFLAYREEQASLIDGGPYFFGGGFYGGGFGYGYGGGFPTEIIPRVCETTFDVAAGRVVTWTLRGNACG